MVICKENDSDELRNQLRRLSNAMQGDGSLGIVQLSHAGRQTPALINPTPYSASDVQLEGRPLFTDFGKPVPIPLEEMETLVIDKFVYAAKVAYETGTVTTAT